jgi:hypothetical protein
MCDYSLHHVATRPAQIEDKLVTTQFSNSITRGFAAVGEPHVAVCLLPRTEIAFDENVECEPSFGIGILPNKKIEQRLARFRQINTDNTVTHHDALEFSDGHVVLLTRLCERTKRVCMASFRRFILPGRRPKNPKKCSRETAPSFRRAQLPGILLLHRSPGGSLLACARRASSRSGGEYHWGRRVRPWKRCG